MTRLGVNGLGKSQIIACIVSGAQPKPGIKSADDLLKDINSDFKRKCVKKIQVPKMP